MWRSRCSPPTRSSSAPLGRILARQELTKPPTYDTSNSHPSLKKRRPRSNVEPRTSNLEPHTTLSDCCHFILPTSAHSVLDRTSTGRNRQQTACFARRRTSSTMPSSRPQTRTWRARTGNTYWYEASSTPWRRCQLLGLYACELRPDVGRNMATWPHTYWHCLIGCMR